MRLIALLAAALALAGCASTEELATRDDAVCQSYGAQPGSAPYVQCRMQQDANRAERRREFAARLQAASASLRDRPAQAEPTADTGPLHGVTCFGKGEYTSGFNKICAYDCLGSAVTKNVSSTALCPLTITQ